MFIVHFIIIILFSLFLLKLTHLIIFKLSLIKIIEFNNNVLNPLIKKLAPLFNFKVHPCSSIRFPIFLFCYQGLSYNYYYYYYYIFINVIDSAFLILEKVGSNHLFYIIFSYLLIIYFLLSSLKYLDLFTFNLLVVGLDYLIGITIAFINYFVNSSYQTSFQIYLLKSFNH